MFFKWHGKLSIVACHTDDEKIMVHLSRGNLLSTWGPHFTIIRLEFTWIKVIYVCVRVIIRYYQNHCCLKSEILKRNTQMFFQENKCIWKCHLRNVVYFVQVSIIWNSQHLHTHILYKAEATVVRGCWWPVTLPVLSAEVADDLGTIGLPLSGETVCADCRKLSPGRYTIFYHMCK